MRSADPAALDAWYRDCLGLDTDENGLWRQGTGVTVFATFESETDYFGFAACHSSTSRARSRSAWPASTSSKAASG
jgi:hypothetical protein